MGNSQGKQRLSDQLLMLLWAQVPALQHLKLLGLSCRVPCKQQQAPTITDLPACSPSWLPACCRRLVAVFVQPSCAAVWPPGRHTGQWALASEPHATVKRCAYTAFQAKLQNREHRLTGVAVQAQAHPPPGGALEWNPRQTDASSTCRTAAAARLAARGLPCFRAPCASSCAVCTSRGPGWGSTNAGAAASGCSRKGVPALLRLLSSCSPVSEAAATRSASISPPAAADCRI